LITTIVFCENTHWRDLPYKGKGIKGMQKNLFAFPTTNLSKYYIHINFTVKIIKRFNWFFKSWKDFPWLWNLE